MKKPRLGVLALMLEAYEPLFPGIGQRQTAYVQEMLDDMAGLADFSFPHIAKNRGEIEALTARYNAEGQDGILLFLLSYSQGQYVVRAMQASRLPLALALVQPDETVGTDFEELDLTVNQGIHGAQDNANCLLRAGIPCQFFAGSRKNGELAAFVADFGAAAMAAQAMKQMKVGIIGKLAGMGDVITDDMAVYSQLGAEFVYDSIGTVQAFCAAIPEAEIAQRMAYEATVFDIDPSMGPAQHAEAVRLYLGLKRYLEANGYAGYTAHFEEFGADGRFGQLPLLAASSLMADGYGYAAEGDASCAMLGAAMHGLCGLSNFSEMYMMDLARDAILFCHAGEGNWKAARKDKKPFLANRVFGEGGLANPPTPLFTPEPGPCAVMSLAYLNGRFRLVYAQGEVLDKCDLTRCDMPYMFFAPKSGVRQCVKAWMEAGGTHHEVVVYGQHTARIRLFCRLMNMEMIEV